MKIFRLGLVPPAFSQAVYHALAREGIESLVILSPASSYVCVGYFQNPHNCVDLEFCQSEGIPVIRREVGGGVVLLDSNQVFYQLILRRGNPLLPGTVAEMYERFSGPPVATYNALGVPARHRPVNDIVTLDGRKVSGQGGADIGPSQVFVGNIILDFDYDTMVRALRVPDEKFRDKVYKTMKDNLTTLKRELGEAPPRRKVEDVLIGEFEKMLGPLHEESLSPEFLQKVRAMEEYLASREFLFREGARPRGVTIREGVRLGRADYKAPGGLITAEVEAGDGTIRWLSLSGDFTFHPKDEFDGLAAAVSGLPPEKEAVKKAVGAYYSSRSIDSPGVTPEDIATVVVKALG
ncbi:MAG: lipoate--protein ligase family protein [Firmicutes bacterium]|nr:lipoate--protein ligase family protein [Bacillota bacterium]